MGADHARTSLQARGRPRVHRGGSGGCVGLEVEGIYVCKRTPPHPPQGRNKLGKTEAWISHSYNRLGGLGQGNSSGVERTRPAGRYLESRIHLTRSGEEGGARMVSSHVQHGCPV